MSLANQTTLIGRLTRETETTDGDNVVLRNTIAVKRDYKNKDGDYESDFISIVAFGKTAEFIEKYFNKGDAIVVGGSIRTGSYTNKDGQKIYTTDVSVDKADFVPGSKKSSDEPVEEEKPKKKSTKKAKKDDDDDFMNVEETEDLPF